MYQKRQQFYGGDGIVKKGVENTIINIGRLGRDGMRETDKEIIRIVADQYGCPTYAADLAEAILEIAAQIDEGGDIAWGTYHYCGKGVTTWHGFAEAIFDVAKEHD